MVYRPRSDPPLRSNLLRKVFYVVAVGVCGHGVPRKLEIRQLHVSFEDTNEVAKDLRPRSRPAAVCGARGSEASEEAVEILANSRPCGSAEELDGESQSVGQRRQR
jgi:hypothetical protein